MFLVYTDGSAYVEDETGAWAYAVIDEETDQVVKWDSGFVQSTTNNRMELQAVIEGLKAFKPSTPVRVISDSAYVINCFKQKWYVKWRRNNWYATSGPVKNPDLWQELLSIVENRTAETIWTHVRGHNGNKWNEYVDTLCTEKRRAGKREAKK